MGAPAAARVAEGTVLRSSLDPGSAEYQANRAAQLELLAQLDEQLELARAGGGPRYVQRHRDRGRLLARERIELLLDRDAPFLELSPLAAWGTDFTVGASVVTGIGVVSRRRVRDHRPRPDRARRRDEPVLAAQDRCGRWRSPGATGCR